MEVGVPHDASDTKGGADAQRPKAATTIMKCTYDVPVGNMSEQEITLHCKKLTMQPTDHGFGSTEFQAYTLDNGYLKMPRFYGQKHFGRADQSQISEGDDIALTFAGTLTDVQKEALSIFRHKCESASLPPNSARGCIISLPCGFGKTVWALNLIAHLKKRACVIVHKQFLLEQWKQQAEKFLPGCHVGRLQGKTCDIGDVTICMVHSLSGREYCADIMDRFGVTIIDECHHQAAKFFGNSFKFISSRFVVGLSATPTRKDGLTHLLHYCMGDLIHKIERNDAHSVTTNLTYYSGATKTCEIKLKDGRVNLVAMITRLVHDKKRTSFIANIVNQYHTHGRSILVLSDRLKHLQDIRVCLTNDHGIDENMDLYVGGTTSDERKRIETSSSIILSTYRMAEEGLDIRRLNTLVLATPKSNIEQAIGRIQRPDGNNVHAPLVEDIVDGYSIFMALRNKRFNYYRQNNYHISIKSDTGVPTS